MDIRQSENYAQYMKLLGWQVEKAGGAGVFIRHFPFFSRWSVIKVQRPENLDLKELEAIAKRHHAIFVKVEPDLNAKYNLLTAGYKRDTWPLLPSKTLVLGISPSIADFYERLPKDTRYEIRQAMKRRVEVIGSKDIELFYKILQETMKIGKWGVPIHKEVVALQSSFQSANSQILIAYYNKVPVGGCLLVWHKEKAHYMYAALTRRGRELGAAYLILFEAIKFLKKNGIKSLDLEGIYDERFPKMTKGWQGFTKFKMGWQGKVVELPGAYTKYFKNLAKLLFLIGDLV